MSSLSKTVYLPHRSLARAGAFITIGSILLIVIGEWIDEVPVGAFLTFLLIGSYGFYIWLASGTTEISHLRVRRTSKLGNYSISWNEVEAIECENSGYAIVLKGHNKQLVILGTVYWPYEKHASAIQLIDEQIAYYNIRVSTSWQALYRFSRNTRERF